jgi:putative endonuclease
MGINMNYSRHYSRRKELAVLGEAQAAGYLRQQGYTIIAQNWRAGRCGEIDIVASDPKSCLVFVEVKTRVAASARGIYLLGFEAINLRKQRKIMRSAWRFQQATGFRASVRFDAIVVIYACYDRIACLEEPEIIHVPNAFAPA